MRWQNKWTRNGSDAVSLPHQSSPGTTGENHIKSLWQPVILNSGSHVTAKPSCSVINNGQVTSTSLQFNEMISRNSVPTSLSFWENNICWANEDIPSILLNPEVHYHVPKILPLVPSQHPPIHKIHIILAFNLDLPSDTFSCHVFLPKLCGDFSCS